MHVYLGSFTPGSTVYGMFNSQDLAGAPITLAGSPALLVYKNYNDTESTSTGITLGVDADSRTGMHKWNIDTSLNSAFFADGSECFVFLSAGTVDGVTVVGKIVAQFSIAAAAAVTANVTQFGGSNGTFASGRPEVNMTHAAGTAWASGGIVSGAFASGAITAAAIAADAIGASELAADAVTEIQTSVLAGITAAYIRTALGMASANLDTQISGIGVASGLSAAQTIAAVEDGLANYHAAKAGSKQGQGAGASTA